tara:strand:+ start:1012 stop:2175 length:1164 start_codon:yes stop_codon:yes gene_type:complete
VIEKESIELLKTLVGFDTTSYKSNLELIKFVESYLSDFGIKSKLIYDDTKKKANLYSIIGPKDVEGIILSGHTDVVSVEDQIWDNDPFKLIQNRDKLYGRGSADMKGFLALVLSRVPKMTKSNLSKSIHLAFSYDEEIGCLGVHRMLDQINIDSINPIFCIVGEPTNMEVVVGHKGKSAHKVDVRGLGYHSGLAPLGVNAIDYASKLILFINKLMNEKSINGPFDYDYEIPYTTLHSGIISGGTALNIVPDLCQFEFEIRYLDKENPEELLNKIITYAQENIIPEMHKKSKNTGIYFKEKISYPGLSIEHETKLVKYIKKLLENEKHKKVVFGSEAGLFKNKLNIPTVVCGPGSIDQAHKANEYITFDQLEKGGRFLDALLLSLGDY